MFRPSLFLSILALSAGAVAQNPPQPALPVPPLPPGAQPGVRPAPVVAPVPPAASGDGVQLQFPNGDIGLILDYYERFTGRRLIRDNQVIGQMNIIINERIPKEEAQKIIEISLLMNGFTIVPVDGQEGKLWKVIGTGKNPRNYGIPILSDIAELPDNEQVVTFLKKLEYADPTELAQVLGQAIPASPTLGQTITPLPKAGALLITENSVIIRGILRILREIDLPPAEVKSEFFSLQRADAKDVLEKLQDIIQPKGQTGTPTTPNPTNARPNAIQQRLNAITPEGVPLPGGTATIENLGNNTIEVNSGRVLSEDAVVVGKTILQADARTNRIHIVTRPVNLKFFRKLIDQLDADTIFGEPVVRPLKFVSAGDIIQAMKQAISDPGGKEEGGAGGAGGNRTGQGNRGNTGSNQNLSDNNRFGSNSNGLGGSGGGGGTGGFSESLNAEERDVVPEAFTVGNTRIIADKRSNAIIVIGNKDVQQKVFAFLDKIDVRSPQVTIRAVIGTLNLDNTDQFGVDYVFRRGGDHGLNGGTTGTGTTASNLVINPANLTNPAGLSLASLLAQSKITQIATGGASGLSGFFTAGNALDVIVQALNTTGRFKVTSNPSIFTSNNKKAVISSGTEIAVPTNITSSGLGNNNGQLSTNSSVQFKTVALQLEVLPLINADGEVQLEIVQKIDELTGVSDTISGNAIPRIATRVLKTNVNVPSGATIVLGGLRRELNTTSKKGIPYLSKLPGLGALFRSTTTQKTRDELIIMLRPIVSDTPRKVIDQRERDLEGFQLEPDLESSLAPQGIRKHVPADETFRRAEPVLREDAATPAPKRLGKRK